MGAGTGVIVPLERAGQYSEAFVGGKARTLGRLLEAGYPVPRGFCIQVEAYQEFLAVTGLRATIAMELGRKSFADMRWEEIWDAALRIRAAFLKHPLPAELAAEIRSAYADLAPDLAAVRSSAPGEDSAGRSFAGLHESVIGIADVDSLLDAVRIVWASLWSDAALLYRKELDLDVTRSRMAVVVQEFIAAPVSGVAFGMDPLNPMEDREVIEAVPGFCEGLVSGAVDPDRWLLKRSTGEPISWTPGKNTGSEGRPVLPPEDVQDVHRTLRRVGHFLGYEPDLEWTKLPHELIVLQARPITLGADDDPERAWYLTLRPGAASLHELCERVTTDLIPALKAEGARLAEDHLSELSDADLADALANRQEIHERWKGIYRDEFIPFAHGVRRLGMYYNDAVRPLDPYEFVGLLEHQTMIATERNAALKNLARMLRNDPVLTCQLQELASAGEMTSRQAWQKEAGRLVSTASSGEFCQKFAFFLDEYLDLTFKSESMDDRPDLVLNILLQLASGEEETSPESTGPIDLEEKLLVAVGSDRQEEAREVLRVGRLSWQLRDDDNILMGALQNQLQRALNLAAERLQASGRLAGAIKLKADSVPIILEALRNSRGGAVSLPTPEPASPGASSGLEGEAPRQLIGQPAARGVASGQVRIVQDPADFSSFQRGEVMVCDAIQPTMTHLVTLASAIIERRGGMLIHGAIIARELGVPCVNGVSGATGILKNGDLVTVDGHLGIVTVGPPEFDLELGQ
jgi:pyruvate,water dikinase|nr:PEP/pyruvate-binding domain-containing protein [Candidatus Krumholzibacteria bacterium]